MLQSYLEHHTLSAIPETVVAFPSTRWQDAQAEQEMLTASPLLYPEAFQEYTRTS